jgi:hypothetical protein
MASAARQRVGDRYDRVIKVLGGKNWNRFDDFVGDKPRLAGGAAAYWAQLPLDRAQRSRHSDLAWVSADEIDAYQLNRETYVEMHAYEGVVPFALLHDGKWDSRAEMGWFGCTHSETEPHHTWARRIYDTLRALPPTTPVTVVDCHI